ncbi:MAG: GNAT family N-acetyltransferase [Solirubrobacteraceae bacterium MAG38_C4-C5]|nr:GNAT family N-acetyltransferase [Candidatus Siliceabacter maunaloa]
MSDVRIAPLARGHRLDTLDSAAEDLDEWLHRFARTADGAGTARTYVLAEGDRVLGYYALAPGAVARRELPERHARGMPAHPIGVILLARLAVDRSRQAQGYGRALVADAAVRTLQAADIVGARAMLVHARDERAAAFYERLGFARSPTDPLHLIVLIKDLRRTFG